MVEHDIWTVKAALDWTVGYLGRKGDENPRLSAEWLLGEHLLVEARAQNGHRRDLVLQLAFLIL